MNQRLILTSFSVLFFLILSLFLTSGKTSTGGEFNVTPDEIFINWTNNYQGNITVQANNVNYNFSVIIDNSSLSYFLFFNYTTEQASPDTCNQNLDYCIFILVRNETGHYVNQSQALTNSNLTNFTLLLRNIDSKVAGKFKGKVKIYNSSNSSEFAHIDIVADIPIRIRGNGIGVFNGTLPPNPQTYQSFYFNISSIENATSISINLTSSNEVDLFLFDESGNLKSKSINEGGNEYLVYSFLPSNRFWEIRIYGNSGNETNYWGNVIFSTLNSSVRELNYGIKNTTSPKNITLINLTNVGNLTHYKVQEEKELYYVKRFNDSAEKTFTFLVPDSSIVSLVKVSLKWKGGSNYSFEVYDPDGINILNSTGNWINANISKAIQEVYGKTTNLKKGYWKVYVKNNTQSNDPYNLTVYLKIRNVGKWISTNFTSNFTFNESGKPNSTLLLQLNFTPQNYSLEGDYEGFLGYFDQNSGGIKIPIRFKLTTPILIVNNTINSTTVKITENIDANLTKILNISINNTGSYNLTNLTVFSSSFLNHTTNPIYFINISSIDWPVKLNANSSSLINLTLEINTANTNDSQGIYKGWIFITTNESDYPANPYQAFNLTLEVNLTSRIIANITGIRTMDGDDWINFTSSPENVTVRFLNLFFINGTKITGEDKFNFSSISLVRLYHRNASYYIPRNGKNLTFNPNGNFEYLGSGGDYTFNFTVPANQPGGIYEIQINLKSLNGKLEGEARNELLVINDTGFYIVSHNCSLSLTEGESKECAVKVKNYGPLKSSNAQVKLIENCNQISVSPSDGRTLDLNGFDFTGKYYEFTITAISNGTCNAWINVTNGKWFENSAKLFSIIVNPKPSEEEGENVTYTLPTFFVDLNFTRAENLITIEQNSTNSTVVIVKNTGNITAEVNFSIEGINSTWFSINSSSATLKVGKEAAFLVNFFVGKEKMEDYAGKFKVVGKNSLWNLEKAITSDFTLRVLPSEETKKWVNETLASLNQNVSLFASQISELKKRNYNTTLAEVLLLGLIKEIEKAENYTKKGDYRTAYYLLDDLISLAEKVADEIKNAKQIIQQKEEEKKAKFQFTTILIVSGAGAAIVLVYLFWPVKPKKFYVLKPSKPIKGTEIWKKLKERWDKLFEVRVKTKRKKK